MRASPELIRRACVHAIMRVETGGTKRAVDAPEIVKNRGDLSLIDDRTSPMKNAGELGCFSRPGKAAFSGWRREALIANA